MADLGVPLTWPKSNDARTPVRPQLNTIAVEESPYAEPRNSCATVSYVTPARPGRRELRLLTALRRTVTVK